MEKTFIFVESVNEIINDHLNKTSIFIERAGIECEVFTCIERYSIYHILIISVVDFKKRTWIKIDMDSDDLDFYYYS